MLILLLIMACQGVPTAPPAQPAGETPTLTATPAPPEEPTAVTEDELDLDEANVMFVKATEAGDGTWRFDVTVRHRDEGWDHYADGWDVVLPDGTVLKTNPDDAFTRVLLHPHDNEQPFTRSQAGLDVPEEVSQVTVRAHCNVHEFGGRDVIVDLMASEGPGFEVERRP